MEVEQTSTSHADDEDPAGDNERGNWHRRLRVRKSSTSSLSVKNTTEEEKKVLKKPVKNEQQSKEAVNRLTFTCSECKDSTRFSPPDLLTHFNSVHAGKGEPPCFPCDMCRFISPDFSILQQHRLKHKHCRLSCEICNDNVLLTLTQLRKHCKAQHSLNGQYHCDKCQFSSKVLKNFIFHSCSDSTEKPGNKPINTEVNNNNMPDDGEPQKEELLKQIPADSLQGWRRKNRWRIREVAPKQQSNNINNIPDLKSLLPKPEAQWTSSGFLPFSAAGLLDENGVLLNPAKTLEETEQFLERSVKSGKKWPDIQLKGESELASLSCLGAFSLQPKLKPCSISLPGENCGDKLSGLMEKNNISVPPDCTTKVLGFKIVDGKKHLILKIIPSSRLETCSDTADVSPEVNPEDTQSGSQMENCAEVTDKNSSFQFCDATSTSGQTGQDEEPTEESSQVENTEHVSGTEADFNAADQRSVEEELMLDSNNNKQLNGGAEDASVEDNSLRELDIQTDHTETNCEDTEMCPDLTASPEHPEESSLPSVLASLGEGLKSNLMLEEGRSSNTILNMMDKEENTSVLQSSADLHSPEPQEAIFEPNTLNPVFVSLHKHATESPFNPPSEDEELLFRDSADENTNTADPREAPVPEDQSCSTETVEDLNYSLGDSHHPDLYQTLEELPVTTVTHLLDEPEVTFRGIASQSSEQGDLSTHQTSLQSPKTIPAAQVTTEDTTQSDVSIHPAMKRKRQTHPNTHDSRKRLVQNPPSASSSYWDPIPQTAVRTLRLSPVYSSQLIKAPHLHQPVIVLNHPDTDIPEVTNIMRVVHKHRGAVQKVVLCQRTLRALSAVQRSVPDRRAWPQDTVRERFILKLKLKRLFGHKYKVSASASASRSCGFQPSFRCWFCGRIFKNQEAWAGHGQRHLMEATRDWNTLFNTAGECVCPV